MFEKAVNFGSPADIEFNEMRLKLALVYPSFMHELQELKELEEPDS